MEIIITLFFAVVLGRREDGFLTGFFAGFLGPRGELLWVDDWVITLFHIIAASLELDK